MSYAVWRRHGEARPLWAMSQVGAVAGRAASADAIEHSCARAIRILLPRLGRKIALGAGLAGIIAAGQHASATTVRKLSLDDLVSAADIVVHARCINTRTEWRSRKIYTVATMEVRAVAKGQVRGNGRFELYMLGGRVEKPVPLKMYVPGSATMAQGEEAVVFLEASLAIAGSYRLVGLQQGKIPVKVDSRTNARTVVHDLPIKGVAVVESAPAAGPDRDVAAVTQELGGGGLEGFLGRIQRIAAEQAAEMSPDAGDGTSAP